MDLTKWKQKFSPLNEVKMPEEFKSKMIETLELELSNGQPYLPQAKVPVSHRRIWLGSSAAGIACTAVIAGGLFLLNNSYHTYHTYQLMPSPLAPTASNSTNSTNTTYTNDTVALNQSPVPSIAGSGNQQVQSAPVAGTGSPNAPVQSSKPTSSNSEDTVIPQTPSATSPPTSASASTAALENPLSPGKTSSDTSTSDTSASDISPSVTSSSDSRSSPTSLSSSSSALSLASSVPMAEGALALFPPQITGTIVAIAPGNPSFATLKDATEVAVPNGPRIHHDSMTIQLPSGGWVGADHWQSVGNTLDLFIGEQILDLNHETTISGISSHNYQGFIKSLQENQMVIQLVEFAGTNAKGQPIEAVTNQLVTLNLKPYTTISWQGGEQVSVSALKPNEPVFIMDEGISSYEIARQITVFPGSDSAGWQVSN